MDSSARQLPGPTGGHGLQLEHLWPTHLRDDQPNALGGETNYDYSARRLMAQVRVDGSPVAQFFYDPYGRRVKIVEGDTTTITLYSGNDIVYEVKTQPGQPTVTTKYLAINGEYLAKMVQEGTNQPQTYFYHVDLVGSVRAITDSQGQVVARFEYEPFGVTTSAMGPLAGSEVHKFTGKREDASVGLYHFNARYYDAVVGRFLSRDPEKQGLNWYEYARSNPLTFIDPNGREVYLALSSLQAATLLGGSAGYGCIVDDHGNYAIVTIAVSVGMGTETLALSQQHIFTSHDTIYDFLETNSVVFSGVSVNVPYLRWFSIGYDSLMDLKTGEEVGVAIGGSAGVGSPFEGHVLGPLLTKYDDSPEAQRTAKQRLRAIMYQLL